MTLEDTKRILVGEWVSFTPEVRPSATRNPDGTLKPFYLSREFKYLGDDRFEPTISNWADPYGQERSLASTCVDISSGSASARSPAAHKRRTSSRTRRTRSRR